MSEYGNDGCHECDGTNGNHYPGCIYDGMGSSGTTIMCQVEGQH